jgi:hypothetical protein
MGDGCETMGNPFLNIPLQSMQISPESANEVFDRLIDKGMVVSLGMINNTRGR